MFELEAPALEVEPEADIQIDEDGETVVVTHPDYEKATRTATVTVRPETAEEQVDRRLIEEQLPRRQFQVFRNSLPLFGPDVSEVRLRTARDLALRAFRYDEDESLTIRHDGSTFRATAEIDGAD